MADLIRVAVNGAAGRMGCRVTALVQEDAQTTLSAALEAADSAALGKDAGELAGIGTAGVAVASELAADQADVIIDFSTPAGMSVALSAAIQHRIPIVIATTGLTEQQSSEVAAAAEVIPIVKAPSMSTAVNLVMKLVRDAARALRDHSGGVDAEVIERHHRFKEDAPSGTALEFGRIIAEEMGITNHVHGRSGRPGCRPSDEIGYHALRTGDNVGEHTIVFGLMGETIDLTVRGHTRDSYARGAITAARFAIGKRPGLYSMADVLGLTE